MAVEPDEVGMAYDPVGDVDREIIARITISSLRHENEVPGPIKRRAGLRDRGRRDNTGRGRCANEKLLHHLAPGLSS